MVDSQAMQLVTQVTIHRRHRTRTQVQATSAVQASAVAPVQDLVVVFPPQHQDRQAFHTVHQPQFRTDMEHQPDLELQPGMEHQPDTLHQPSTVSTRQSMLCAIKFPM